MGKITTTVAPPMFPEGQQAFASWLFGGLGQKPDGGWSLGGATPYPGSLYPALENTILPSVWGAWQPQDAGQQMLAMFLGQGMSPGSQTNVNNMFQYGGPAGWPTELMHNMAQFGGAGEPTNFMSNIMQFGAPTKQAGQPMQQIAQTGGAGQWGQMLQAMALGQNNPMLQYLQPFLGGKPYTAPAMNWGGK